MKHIVVTTGETFTDIDGLACAVALAELYTALGDKALAVLEGPLNHSIPSMVLDWGVDVGNEPPRGDNNYVLVDVSEKANFASFVEEEKIIGIFDHHPGSEEYWKKKLGSASIIEPVGSCATLIWEQFKKAQITPTELSARLMSTAIVSNTLNFHARLTKDRDYQAYEEVVMYANLKDTWQPEYFKSSEVKVFSDIPTTVRNDTKQQVVQNLGYTITIGQLELWDGSSILKDYQDVIREVLSAYSNPRWFMTIPSISEGKNYLLADNEEVQVLLNSKIGSEFEGSIGTTNELWLRKEILAELFTD